MLNKLIKYVKNMFDQIKYDDVVIIKDDSGNESIGKLKKYTPKYIIIEKSTFIEFDARNVTMEKLK